MASARCGCRLGRCRSVEVHRRHPLRCWFVNGLDRVWRCGCVTVECPIICGILHRIPVTSSRLRHLRCVGPSRRDFSSNVERPRCDCAVPCMLGHGASSRARSVLAPLPTFFALALLRAGVAAHGPRRNLNERRLRSCRGNGLSPGVCFARSARRGAQSLDAKFVRRDSPVERGSGAMRGVLGAPRRSLSGSLPYHSPVLGGRPSISRCRTPLTVLSL